MVTSPEELLSKMKLQLQVIPDEKTDDVCCRHVASFQARTVARDLIKLINYEKLFRITGLHAKLTDDEIRDKM